MMTSKVSFDVGMFNDDCSESAPPDGIDFCSSCVTSMSERQLSWWKIIFEPELQILMFGCSAKKFNVTGSVAHKIENLLARKQNSKFFYGSGE